MRISRKILFLVSIPIAFQLGMSVFLFNEVQTSQKRIEQELERKRIVATLDKVHHLHVRSLGAAAFYSINRDAEIGKRHFALLKELTAEVKVLAQQTSSNAEFAELTKKLRQSIATVVKYELLMRKLSLMTDAPQTGTSDNARAAIKDSIHQIEDFQERLLPPSDDFHAFQTAATEQFLRLAVVLLAIVGLTGMLLVWSQKNILELLNSLLIQIGRFKNGESIKPRLAPGTEMAELEVVICDAASRISNLERLRRELSSIVAHDVRAPMTSIEGVVTLLEAGAFGELKKAQQELVAQQKSISHDLLDVLNNILDLDKLRSGKWSISITQTSCNEISNRIRAEVFSACAERNVLAEITGVEVDSFACDVDALARAIVALAGACESDTAEMSVKCTSSNVDFTVHGLKPDSPLLRGEHGHKLQIALGLAQLFCEVQNLELSTERSDTTINFKFSPRRAGAIAIAETPVPNTLAPNTSNKIKVLSKVGGRLQGLISLPMAVSLTAVILYGVFLNQFAQDIGRELVSREIVHRATNISSGNTQLLLLSIRRTPEEPVGQDKSRQKIKAKLDADMLALRNLEAQARLSMPTELALVQKKVDDVKHLSDELVAGPIGDLPERLKQLSGKDGQLFSIAFKKAGSLLSEREAQDTTTKALTDLRTNVLNLLIFASIATVLVTIYSARRIVLEFVSRLNNVGWNARRLARREPLREPDKGDDEIADLDSFFYKVATQIDQLENERKHLAGLLREQMKMPLLNLRDGFKALFKDTVESNEKATNRIQRVLAEIDRLSDLVDDLLILDSLEAGGDLAPSVSLSKVSLKDVVEPSIDAVAAQAELKGIKIDRDDFAPVCVVADVRASIRIVVNLLSNAVKFSRENTTVTVGVNADRGEFVRVFVIDNGRGIPDDEKFKIFSRFDQVSKDDSSKGSGLGLFISKKLAEAQGGELTFESSEGVGTTFYLTLRKVPD